MVPGFVPEMRVFLFQEGFGELNIKGKGKSFEVIDHTADIGLKVYGKDKKELFINAAQGMFFLITGSVIVSQPDRSKKYFDIESKAANMEDLLVAWLDDLLYIYFTEFVLFEDYEIISLTDEMIKTRVRGIKIEHSPYQIVQEIKAVTYHNLLVHELPNGEWEATVLFDI
ncbi:MAG TPA: archease [Atribacterota bacterium]|nr:archease [Atribacterota bacterium]HPK87200.1 archease [Atribacterota bacterium]